jgi:1-acyl-sn-glycerol-3-phosphate acyltransferase
MNDRKSKAPPAPPDADASERLVRAEGADVPQRTDADRSRRRPRRHPRRERPSHLPHAMRERLDAHDPERPGPPDSPPNDGGEARGSVAERIRELEARLDQMILARERAYGDSSPAAPRPTLRSEPPPWPSVPPPDRSSSASLAQLAADLEPSPWGRLGLREGSEETDDFGYDPAFEQRALPVFEFLYAKYFRVETSGIDHVPSDGRCLLVANHSGTLPLDGMMLRLAVRREHAERREVRWLAEDGIFHLPFLGSFTNRMGAVRACQENAERLLAQGALVAVFPEGMKGIGKLFRDRYKLQRFGRGGFVKLCMRTRTPVVPVAIVGSEETNPMLARIERLAKTVGIPYLPVTPTFPLLGPIGLLPAPTKWKIVFGEPIDFSAYGAGSAEDEILVSRQAERVRAEIQSMLDRTVAARRSVWFG